MLSANEVSARDGRYGLEFNVQGNDAASLWQGEAGVMGRARMWGRPKVREIGAAKE